MNNDLIQTDLKTYNVNSKHPTEEICQHLRGLDMYYLMTTTNIVDPVVPVLKDWLDNVMLVLQQSGVIENYKVAVDAIENNDKSREIQIKIRFKQSHCLNFTHIHYIVIALVDNGT